MKEVPLGELCTFCKGISVPRDQTSIAKTTPYLHYGDLYKKYDFRIDLDSVADTIIKIDNIDKVTSEQYLHDGDVVYTLTSETVDDLGHATLVSNKTDSPFVAGMETTVIHISRKDLILPAFLNYTFHSSCFKLKLRQYVTGMKVFRVHPRDLMRITINLASLDVQKSIIGILDALSDCIVCNSQINDYLMRTMNCIFEHALVEKCAPVTVGEVIDLEDSKRIPLNKMQREARKGNYPYYGATTIMGYVDDYLFDDIRLLLSEDGSVITNNDSPVLQYVWGRYWVNNHAHILKSKGKYSLEMLYLALQHTTITHLVTGAVQMKISQGNLNSLILQLPDPDSIPCLSKMFELYRNNIDVNMKLVATRDYLLPKLMSGEIDISILELSN